jgi:hypothetical protein
MRVVAYGFGMRSPVWRVGAALAVLVAALAVGGCVEDEPDPTQSPDPSPSPLFESDEEALAAAEEAYGRYQAVENQIFAEGGQDGERIDDVAVGEALTAAEEGIESFKDNNYKSIGEIKFSTVSLQQFDPAAVDGADVVRVYICLDFTAQDVVNDQNISVVNPDRSLIQAFEMGFDYASNGLVLSSRNPWTDDTICT